VKRKGTSPLMQVTIGGKQLKEGETWYPPNYVPSPLPPPAPLVTIKGVRTRARIKFEFDTTDDGWDPRNGPFPLREFSAEDLRDVLRLIPELDERRAMRARRLKKRKDRADAWHAEAQRVHTKLDPTWYGRSETAQAIEVMRQLKQDASVELPPKLHVRTVREVLFPRKKTPPA
jgi:hypothetical protein